MIYNDLGFKVRNKALEIGFDQCGIIKINEVKEYSGQLLDKQNNFPEVKPFYDHLAKLAFPETRYEWAKSIVVCVKNYGKYKIPRHLDGIISKFYLFDYKWKNYSEDFQRIEIFDKYLSENGIKAEKDPAFGVAPSRLCAVKANLGIIRRNNFFYNNNGSWNWIEIWVTDQIMEFKEEKAEIEECPEECRECIKACPTNALCKPYFTNILTCVTRLSYGTRGVTPQPLREKMKTWIYGCDECQNACPKNKDKWKENEEFKYPPDFINKISLEEIVSSDTEILKNMFHPVFSFINRDRIWVWKCNALIAMANKYKPEYKKHIVNSLESDNENIRETAKWAKEKIGLLN